VYVDAAVQGRAQVSVREDAPVGDDDDGVHRAVREEVEGRVSPDLLRLVDGEAAFKCELLDGGDVQTVAAARRPVRLRPDGDDLVPVLHASPQRRHRRLGRAHEDKTHKSG
jgi:hypothetical protein